MNETPTTQLYIDGARTAAAAGGVYPLYNPAKPDELVGHAADAQIEDLNRACDAAHAAFPAWSALSYARRAQYLLDIAEYLVADEQDLKYRSELFCREHGKILAETRMEMSRLGDRFRLAASYAERLAEDEAIQGPPFDTIVTRQPHGPAALVVPWNWPLSILGAKLPHALMAGSTVVIKPSKSSAMAPVLTIQKIAEKLPAGVVNVITGSASQIGDPLLQHPHIRFINFTGSVPVGKHVMRLAAETLKPVTLELGGNDAGIVLEDAELDEDAYTRMYFGAFGSTGQICMALKRLYVVESRYEDVVAGMTAVCARQVVGDGMLPATTMGPLNNAGQLNIVQDMIAQARAAGADVRELGQVPDQAIYEAGYFQKPTLILDPPRHLDIVREEQFGPALPIIPVKDEAEAIAEANASPFGLCSSVWTADKDRALRVSKALQAGYTYINNHGPRAQDSRAPFGGFKDSGIGRNLGYEGVTSFQGYHAMSSVPGWLL
ncbi:MAG: aldehyde dehydrogenase family protein [Pseudomonadota bacterium]